MTIFKRLSSILFFIFALTNVSLAADYHVFVNGAQQGPVSMEKFRQMTGEGIITRDNLVWKTGMAQWQKAGLQEELKPLFAQDTTPPPLPPPQSSSPPSAPSTPPPAPPVTLPESTQSADFSSEKAIGQTDVTELNGMSDAKAIQTASDDMEDWADSVLEQFNIEGFGEVNGKFIFFASQSLSQKPTDPNYGDALSNAFDKAMMSLQEKYLMNRFGKISTDKVRSFYSDRSTNARDIALPAPSDPGFSGKLFKLLGKGLDLADKKLDEELIKLGTDPAELAKMPPTKKKDLLRDKFIKNTLKEASGSIAGLFPIQTNIIVDKAGRTVVGVVGLASPKTLQIAKDIRLQRKSLIKGKGRDIKSLLPETPQAYIGTLGVRLAYDKDGTPAIMSYGIASYFPDTGDDYINDELKADAKNAAISSADAQIAEIISGEMNAKNHRKTGEEINKYVQREMKVNSDTIEKDIKNIIKISSREASSSAQAKLQGISTVKTWRYTHKNGQKFVGAVRVWKYATLAAVNAFNKPKPAQSKKKKKTAKTNQTFQQTSKAVNTINDF